MSPRIPHPAMTVPGAMDALQALAACAEHPDVPRRTIDLMQLRASQINGCEVCIDGHCLILTNDGESAERMAALPGWREASCFTPAERAALALTEAVTRLSDRTDPVPDDVWSDAARHYSEPALGALLFGIVAINAWTRLNIATAQVPGIWEPA